MDASLGRRLLNEEDVKRCEEDVKWLNRGAPKQGAT